MFCDLTSGDLEVIMYQLKSIYNSPFKDSLSHPIHICFAIIASNDAFNSMFSYCLTSVIFTVS